MNQRSPHTLSTGLVLRWVACAVSVLPCSPAGWHRISLRRWRLTVSEDKGFSLQNVGHAPQWWAFSIFVLGMRALSMRDANRKHNPSTATEAAPEPVVVRDPQPAYRRYVMPTSVPQHVDDPLHNAYNDCLAWFAADSDSVA